MTTESPSEQKKLAPRAPRTLTHLQQLEAEAIHIIREVAAEFANPVMLYSIGKDSAVMVRLAQKAFFPGRLPARIISVPRAAWKDAPAARPNWSPCPTDPASWKRSEFLTARLASPLAARHGSAPKTPPPPAWPRDRCAPLPPPPVLRPAAPRYLAL